MEKLEKALHRAKVCIIPDHVTNCNKHFSGNDDDGFLWPRRIS